MEQKYKESNKENNEQLIYKKYYIVWNRDIGYEQGK